jgi:type VII secretion protein EccB
MATRRDELSAHSFARKRMLAAFLQPQSRVSDDEAPRPVRAFMPSAVMSVVLVAGCIAWGAISPSAPPGWDETGKYIIVDSDSTTRYVVLPAEEDGKKIKMLHPVLNFASAKLVLDKGKGEVIEVSGEDIDKSDIPRGATIGIPYAPDRLPKSKEAETPKEWAVCEKPGRDGEPEQGVFVMGGRDADILKGKGRLGKDEALYVEAPPEKPGETPKRYIVDGNGTKLLLQGHEGSIQDRDLLTKLVLKNPGQPQKVSEQWLSTLKTGDPLTFDNLSLSSGTPVTFDGSESLPPAVRRQGMVLKSTASGTPYYYVVLDDGVQQVTPLLAHLMMGGQELQKDQKPYSVSPVTIANMGGSEAPIKHGGAGWPDDVLTRVNTAADGLGTTEKLTSCSIYTGKTSGGEPKLAAWAGHDYPANIVNGSSRAYVTHGTGLLYQEFTGSGGGGRPYLLTDSGLRYAVDKKAKIRLGYGKTKVALVPKQWSELLPKGPSLNTKSASQEQGM